jgi:hypothetical protein
LLADFIIDSHFCYTRNFNDFLAAATGHNTCATLLKWDLPRLCPILIDFSWLIFPKKFSHSSSKYQFSSEQEEDREKMNSTKKEAAQFFVAKNQDKTSSYRCFHKQGKITRTSPPSKHFQRICEIRVCFYL